MSRYARNVDRGHHDIVQALRAFGASVVSLAALGKGAPDLAVGFRGETTFLEVKAPLGPQGGASEDGQKLSPGQEAWHASWKGRPVQVVRSQEEALRAIGAIR